MAFFFFFGEEIAVDNILNNTLTVCITVIFIEFLLKVAFNAIVILTESLPCEKYLTKVFIYMHYIIQSSQKHCEIE